MRTSEGEAGDDRRSSRVARRSESRCGCGCVVVVVVVVDRSELEHMCRNTLGMLAWRLLIGRSTGSVELNPTHDNSEHSKIVRMERGTFRNSLCMVVKAPLDSILSGDWATQVSSGVVPNFSVQRKNPPVRFWRADDPTGGLKKPPSQYDIRSLFCLLFGGLPRRIFLFVFFFIWTQPQWRFWTRVWLLFFLPALVTR